MNSSTRSMERALGVTIAVTVILVVVTSTLAEAPRGIELSNGPPSLFLPYVSNNAAGTSNTSFELIEQALARGEIDEETALVYKVFAVYLDPRLPARFIGDDSRVRDTLITAEVGARWSSLSPATQALLAPFLLPPAAPGSWLELQLGQRATARPAAPIEWRTLSRPGGEVKVWYQTRYSGDETRAALLLADLEDVVWPKLTELMGRGPLSDAGLPNNGGDALFDVYLVRIASYGEAHAYPPSCEQRPSFLLIDGVKPNLRETLAHEFFHALTWGYNVSVGCVHPGEYRWLNEASATWAEDYVSPQVNSEQEYAYSFLGRPHWSLETVGETHEYGAYLWPFFLARTFQPGLVRTIWDATQSKNSLAAVDGAISGGFLEQWPEFARLNLNREPVEDYEQWDSLPAGAAFRWSLPVSLLSGGQLSWTMPAAVPHLAAHYFNFTFPDPAVTTVRFQNADRFFAAAEPRAKVQAQFKIAGQGWTTEDWTALPERVFCRTDPAERVEALVVIISNSEWQDRSHILNPGTELKLTASDTPCSCEELAAVQNWTGQVSFSFTTSASSGDESITYDHSATVNLQMVPDYQNSSYVGWKSVSLGGTGHVYDVHTDPPHSVETLVGSGALYPGGSAQDSPKAMLGVSLSTCTFGFYLMTGMPAQHTIFDETFTVSTGVGIMDIDDIPATQLAGSRIVPAFDDPTYSDEPSWFVPASRMDVDLWWLVGNDFGVATVNWSFAPAD
jgi:hypothetical protein